MCECISYASELLVFLYLGLGLFAVDHDFHRMGLGLLMFGFLAIAIGRFINIYGLSATINCFSRKTVIPCKFMVRSHG